MQRLRILIIDNDSSIANLLSEILKLWNHSCYIRFDLDDALDFIEQTNFDLIFIHSSMTNMSIHSFEKLVDEKNPRMRSRLRYTTGYKNELLKHQVNENKILEKPFKIKSVRLMIEKRKAI